MATAMYAADAALDGHNLVRLERSLGHDLVRRGRALDHNLARNGRDLDHGLVRRERRLGRIPPNYAFNVEIDDAAGQSYRGMVSGLLPGFRS